jgi:hypothetical protein
MAPAAWIRNSLKGMEFMGIDKSIQLISLDKSLLPLKNHFNDNSGRLQFLALLSPT